MALTFRKFAVGFMELPATIFSGLLDLTFGYTQREDQGKAQVENERQPIVRDGFVSFTLDFIKELGRGIADLAANNKKVIATAFWSSLTVAGGLALTLFLWPAALTAVANFSVFGFSIAGLIGTNPLLQIGVAAGLIAAATSVATYFADAVVNTISALVNACRGAPKTSDSCDDLEAEGVASPLGKLASTSNETARQTQATPPVHTTSPIHSPSEQKQAEQAEQENPDLPAARAS